MIRRWSIVLWIFAFGFGFWYVQLPVKASHVAILLVVPRSDDKASYEQALSDDFDQRLGEEGLGERILVVTKHLDVEAEKAQLDRLGFGPSDEIRCAIVETDAKGDPSRVVKRYEDIDDPADVADRAIDRARAWAELNGWN